MQPRVLDGVVRPKNKVVLSVVPQILFYTHNHFLLDYKGKDLFIFLALVFCTIALGNQG